MKCPKCGSRVGGFAHLKSPAYLCTKCGIVITKWQQEEIESLRQGMAWQPGKPDRNGNYWVKYNDGSFGIMHDLTISNWDRYCADAIAWSGPIPLPVDKIED